MKLGLWLGIGLLAYFWFNYTRKRRSNDARRAQEAMRPSPASMPPAGESMLACAQCGMHVPASDVARSVTGLNFCSPAHRHLYQDTWPDDAGT